MDLNCRPLVSEKNALPTEPQPLPNILRLVAITVFKYFFIPTPSLVAFT